MCNYNYSLTFSLAFWYIPENEVLTVTLLSREQTLQTVTVDTNDNSDIRDNVREIYVSVTIIMIIRKDAFCYILSILLFYRWYILQNMMAQ